MQCELGKTLKVVDGTLEVKLGIPVILRFAANHFEARKARARLKRRNGA
jgi:hypothetical protein